MTSSRTFKKLSTGSKSSDFTGASHLWDEDQRPTGAKSVTAKWFRSHRKVIFGSLTFLLVVALWQLFGTIGLVNPAFVSYPSAIWTAGIHYMSTPAFLKDISASGGDFLIGFFLSVVVGILIGFAMGWFPLVNEALDYLVSFAYAAPRIALVPILLVWFGVGAKTEIATIFLMSVFPLIINTATGVRTVDKTLVEMSRAFGGSTSQVLTRVVLPASVPYILSGVRLAIGVGLIGVVVAEFTAASVGIGYMMENAANSFQTAKIFFGLVVISLAGLLLTQLAARLERHFDKWRTTVSDSNGTR